MDLGDRFVIIALLAALLLPAAGANASEAREHRVSAWFLGDKPVKWCLELEKGLPEAEATRAKTVFTIAFIHANAVWTQYIRAKRINEDSPEHLVLPTRWEPLDACDGKQDLTLFVGDGHAVPEAYKKAFRDPVGFAQRTSYDELTGWGNGFIWVARESLSGISYQYIKALFMHELGHVFGCEHVQGTIMDENIGHDLRFIDSRYKVPAALTEIPTIDGDRELYVCEDCDFKLLDESPSDPTKLQTAFKAIIGKSPDGGIKFALHNFRSWLYDGVVFYLWDKPIDQKTWWSSLLGLTSQSEVKKLRNGIPVEFTRSVQFVRTTEASVFRKLYRGETHKSRPYGLSLTGTIDGPKRQKIPILINRNLGNLLEIMLIVDGQPVPVYKLNAANRHLLIFGTNDISTGRTDDGL